MSPYTPRRQIVAKIKKKKEIIEHRKELVLTWQEKLSQFIKIAFSLVQKLASQVRLLPNIKLIKISYEISKIICRENIIILLTRFKKIKLPQQPSLNLNFIKKLIHKIIKVIHFPIWTWRYQLISMLFLILIGINIQFRVVSSRNLPINNTFYAINLWPTLPRGYFELSRVYFDKGNELEARNYFSKGDSIYNAFKIIGIGRLFNTQYLDIKATLQAPGKNRQQIIEIEKMEKLYPYSWQLLASKAKFQKELYLENDYQLTKERVEWLYPDFDFSKIFDL